MFIEIVQNLDKTLANATALLALTPNMTIEEQTLTENFVLEVLENTSIMDLKEKDSLIYLKLYLKTRKEHQIGLEELINDTQRERLEGL